MRLLGGGAQSELWCQIYADVLGRPVDQVPDPRHAQLRGAALWALICLGELRLEDVPTLIPATRTFTPDRSRSSTYQGLYAEYTGLHGSLKGLYKRINGASR